MSSFWVLLSGALILMGFVLCFLFCSFVFLLLFIRFRFWAFPMSAPRRERWRNRRDEGTNAGAERAHLEIRSSRNSNIQKFESLSIRTLNLCRTERRPSAQLGWYHEAIRPNGFGAFFHVQFCLETGRDGRPHGACDDLRSRAGPCRSSEINGLDGRSAVGLWAAKWAVKWAVKRKLPPGTSLRRL